MLVILFNSSPTTFSFFFSQRKSKVYPRYTLNIFISFRPFNSNHHEFLCSSFFQDPNFGTNLNFSVFFMSRLSKRKFSDFRVPLFIFTRNRLNDFLSFKRFMLIPFKLVFSFNFCSSFVAKKVNRPDGSSLMAI